MTLGEFKKYLFNGKICLDHTKVKNVIIESRDYIPELNLRVGNFVVKNPIDLVGDVLNREVVGISAYNNQVVVIIR